MNLQILFNGLIAFGSILLIALSFYIIYSVTKFFYFAHAGIIVAGSYFVYLFKDWFGFPFIWAVLLGISCCALLGWIIERSIYRFLRKKKASFMIMLLSSLGINIILLNIISIIFGDDAKSIRFYEIQEGLNVLGARITPLQIFMIFFSIILMFLLEVFFTYTKLGKGIRAVSNDIELAEMTGIDSNIIISMSFLIGSALGGIAGILIALDADMTPSMGLNGLMMGFVAIIIGGIGKIYGVALGAFLVGMAKHFGIWGINSQWQDMNIFVILFIFLIIKPDGFIGKRYKGKRL